MTFPFDLSDRNVVFYLILFGFFCAIVGSYFGRRA
jgi:hypothetical protein